MKKLGHFRTAEEAIVDSETNEIINEFVEPEYVEGEVDKFVKWLHEKSKNCTLL